MARDSSNSASPDGARRCRNSTSVGGVRRPQPDVAVAGRALEPGLEQLAAQQPGDAAVLEVDDAVVVADVTEGDPDGERVGPVVAEQRRYLGPRLRTDQLKRDGGRVPGGPSARHVRSTTVASRSDVALHFLHIRHTRRAGGSVCRALSCPPRHPDEPQKTG